MPKGELNSQASLSDAEVELLRQLFDEDHGKPRSDRHWTARRLAEKFEISIRHVWYIVSYQRRAVGADDAVGEPVEREERGYQRTSAANTAKAPFQARGHRGKNAPRTLKHAKGLALSAQRKRAAASVRADALLSLSRAGLGLAEAAAQQGYTIGGARSVLRSRFGSGAWPVREQ